MIRILVVDDLAAVRTAIRMRLSAELDMVVIGEASDGEVAVAMAAALCPDVVLMDVQMPRMDGISATRALQEKCPDVRVVVLTIQDDETTRCRAENAGAAAFVAKTMPPDALPATIRQVAARAPGQGSANR
jgi:DNA-binding NarL/FixJ family response regulator